MTPTECKELRTENKRLSRQIAEDSIKLLVFGDVVTENDTLRATLRAIQTEGERYPVPGGYTYAISGQVMGMVDEVLR